MLDRETLRKAMRGPIKTIDVPEWGGEVGIRRLSAGDLVRLRELIKIDGTERTEAANLNATCEMLAMSLCDSDAKPIFTADELRDWDGQQVGILQTVLAAAQEHNGMGDNAAEDLEKNSESGQTSGST